MQRCQISGEDTENFEVMFCSLSLLCSVCTKEMGVFSFLYIFFPSLLGVYSFNYYFFIIVSTLAEKNNLIQLFCSNKYWSLNAQESFSVSGLLQPLTGAFIQLC